MNEGKVALLAAAISGVVLLITFSGAAVMRGQTRQSSVTSAVVPTLPAPTAEKGRQLFLQSCAHCHGDDARGDDGPDLHNLRISDAHIALVVKNGIKGDMPAFAKKHDDADIAALTSYLRTLR